MKKIIIFFIFFLSFKGFTEVSELLSLKDLSISKESPKTLFVFDLDNTVFKIDGIKGSDMWFEYVRAYLKKKRLPMLICWPLKYGKRLKNKQNLSLLKKR